MSDGKRDGDGATPPTKDDGVNRDGLDFRAGWLEAITAFLQRLQLASVRAKKNETAGMQLCHGIALDMRKVMLAKMQGKE